MGTITLDDSLRAKLHGGRTTVEVCDNTGETVGYYLPRDEYVRLLYAIELAKPPMTEAERGEVRQDFRDGRYLNTVEVLARLHELDNQLRKGRTT